MDGQLGVLERTGIFVDETAGLALVLDVLLVVVFLDPNGFFGSLELVGIFKLTALIQSCLIFSITVSILSYALSSSVSIALDSFSSASSDTFSVLSADFLVAGFALASLPSPP